MTRIALLLAAWVVGSNAPSDVPPQATCTLPTKSDRVLLVMVAGDRALVEKTAAVRDAIARAAGDLFVVSSADAAHDAMTAEEGREERRRLLESARDLLVRGEERFRELDDDAALALFATATAQLSASQQEPGAIEALADAHLLSGAIFLARDRLDAARQRFQRALDLNPELAPARTRFAPRVLAEVASLRASEAQRPVGVLEVDVGEVGADVFLDGRRVGSAPLSLSGVGAGRHLVRIGAVGRRSSVTTVDIAPGETHRLSVQMVDDAEFLVISTLAERMATGANPSEVLDLLARRSRSDRVLAARVFLAGQSSLDGGPIFGVDFRAQHSGASQARRLDGTELGDAMARAFTCADGESSTDLRIVPPIFDALAAGAADPREIPPEMPLWRRPWVWAAAGVLALGLASAAVAVRASEGPADTIEVRLIPRP